MPDAKKLDIESRALGEGMQVLSLSGFLDAHTFEQLDETISNCFDEDTFKIVADLSGVEYISSAGAGVFIGSLTTAQESGGNIVLVNPTPNVREVFDLLGLSQIFEIVDSVEEAGQIFE